jgi:hypothetical protein
MPFFDLWLPFGRGLKVQSMFMKGMHFSTKNAHLLYYNMFEMNLWVMSEYQAGIMYCHSQFHLLTP